MTSKQHIPWVEKYRPTQFDNIVLDPINRRIFKNILNKDYFPNLLFYGPPGTGKTTTIINLIQEYQTKHNQKNKGMMIHLNASDERGIGIIRNQINQFVKSNNFFDVGLKFVILDEVDYMTKDAQQALKYLLQSSCYNVRFCLICNYISKIDESLKNEFICVRFNQLPKYEIYKFIKTIAENENLSLSDAAIDTIQHNYHSDIRSMINFLQLNQNVEDWEQNIVTDTIWETIHKGKPDMASYIHEISVHYNMNKKTVIKNYFNYVIRNKPECIDMDFLNKVEFIMHSKDINMEHILMYLTK